MLILAMSGMGGVEFSVVLPSLWHYVQQLAPPPREVEGLQNWSERYTYGYFRLDLDPITTLLFAQTTFTFASMFAKPLVGVLSDRVGFRIATFNGRDRAMDVARLDGDDDAATDDGAAPAPAFGRY